MDRVLDALAFLHKKRDADDIRQEKLDDNCERAMFTAFHILVTLCEKEAIPESVSERLENPKESSLEEGIGELTLMKL